MERPLKDGHAVRGKLDEVVLAEHKQRLVVDLTTRAQDRYIRGGEAAGRLARMAGVLLKGHGLRCCIGLRLCL